MKNINVYLVIAIVVLLSESARAQNVWVKLYNPEYPNHPVIDTLMNGANPGEHVFGDSSLHSEIVCYMDMLERAYYMDATDVINEIDTLVDDMIFERDTSSRFTNSMTILYLDSMTREVIIETNRVQFTIPSYGYTYLFRNRTRSGSVIETLYIVSKEFGHGNYNLSTGECLKGNEQCWESFVYHSGFFVLLSALESLCDSLVD